MIRRGPKPTLTGILADREHLARAAERATKWNHAPTSAAALLVQTAATVAAGLAQRADLDARQLADHAVDVALNIVAEVEERIGALDEVGS